MPDLRDEPPAAIFVRPSRRHEQRVHTGEVVAVEARSPHIVRVTLGGEDLADLVSTGPADHVRVFFPTDPWSREPTHLPALGPVVHRDFTPLPAVAGAQTVGLDFALHPEPGPASTWAADAQIGMQLSLAGPRGSRGVPTGAARLLLIGDETSLPSISRWIGESNRHVAVDVIATVQDRRESRYLAQWAGDDRVRMRWLEPADHLIDAIEEFGSVDGRTFVFAAGEAGAMRPLRHHLRRELGLPAEQVVVSGYWRAGAAGYDHHQPLDPNDPDPRPGGARESR